MELGKKLLFLRKEKGLSQLKLAEMMNVSRQAISRWEVGTAIPSIDNLKMLGDLYGVSVDYLLDDGAENCSEKNNNRTPATDESDKKSNRKKCLGILLCILAIAVAAVTIIIFMVNSNQEQDQIIPIEDMTNDEGDDFPTVRFPIN